MSRLCDACLRKCKQPENIRLVQCLKYRQEPVQLAFKFPNKKKSQTK